MPKYYAVTQIGEYRYQVDGLFSNGYVALFCFKSPHRSYRRSRILGGDILREAYARQ